MKSKFVISLLILMCFIGCGSDEEEEASESLRIVNTMCDGETITVKFNKPPGYLEVSFQYEGWEGQFLPPQEVTGIKWQGNSVSFPYPLIPNNTMIRHFSIESESDTEIFPNPCN